MRETPGSARHGTSGTWPLITFLPGKEGAARGRQLGAAKRFARRSDVEKVLEAVDRVLKITEHAPDDEAAEWADLVAALRKAGSVRGAAREIGASRDTVYRRIKKYEIDDEEWRG